MSGQGQLFAAPAPPAQSGIAGSRTGDAALGQYMTPSYAAALLVERHFSDLATGDVVVEPSCGSGAFLNALPLEVRAIGVEIDPSLAQVARRLTGREVIDGDFRDVALPVSHCDAVIGNPPFAVPLIEAFLERAYRLLPADGRMGLILPGHFFQTSRRVAGYSARWGLEVESIPRDLFTNLSCPLCFALFHKSRPGRLIGLALYHEAAAVRELEERYRSAFEAMGQGSVWRRVVALALRDLGGRASLQSIYERIAHRRPTSTQFWREAVRKALRDDPFERLGPAEYALAG